MARHHTLFPLTPRLVYSLVSSRLVLPHKVWGDYFQAFHGKTYGKKNMAKFLILNGGLVMIRLGEEFHKNDRCIFQ